jgi:hypothetical protein
MRLFLRKKAAVLRIRAVEAGGGLSGTAAGTRIVRRWSAKPRAEGGEKSAKPDGLAVCSPGMPSTASASLGRGASPVSVGREPCRGSVGWRGRHGAPERTGPRWGPGRETGGAAGFPGEAAAPPRQGCKSEPRRGSGLPAGTVAPRLGRGSREASRFGLRHRDRPQPVSHGGQGAHGGRRVGRCCVGADCRRRRGNRCAQRRGGAGKTRNAQPLRLGVSAGGFWHPRLGRI